MHLLNAQCEHMASPCIIMHHHASSCIIIKLPIHPLLRRDPREPRAIEVTGGRDNVRRASGMVADTIQHLTPESHIQMIVSHIQMSVSHTPTIVSHSPTSVMCCPGRYIGHVIGRRGEMIKHLQRLYKCSISVDQSCEPMAITIQGAVPHMTACERAIAYLSSDRYFEGGKAPVPVPVPLPLPVPVPLPLPLPVPVPVPLPLPVPVPVPVPLPLPVPVPVQLPLPLPVPVPVPLPLPVPVPVPLPLPVPLPVPVAVSEAPVAVGFAFLFCFLQLRGGWATI